MEAPWLFWLLLLGCPGYPTASVEYIFGNFTKDLIEVIHGYIEQDLVFPFSLVEYLPDDFRPDPDFYGLPRKPVIIAAYLGIASLAIFIWSSVLSVKPQIYQVNLWQIMLKIKDCMEENAKLPEKIFNLEKKINESKKQIQETKRNNNILSDEVNKFKVNIETLEGRNEKLGDILEQTQATLQSERLQNANNQDLILEQEKVIANLKGFILKTASDMNEVQNALHEAKIIEAKAKTEDEQVWKENAQLKAQEEQLQQEIEHQRKEYSALQEQIIVLEKTHKDLEGAQCEKDNNIAVLNDCISQLRGVSESATEDKHTDMNGELAGDMNSKMKLQMIQMMDVSQAKTAISAAEDDLKQLKFQLSTLISTNCKLQEHREELEEDCYLSRAVKAAEAAERKTLRLKVEILEKIFEPKRMAAEEKLELKVHERNKCQSRLLEEEEKAKVVAEEVKYYMQRIEEMEQKLQQTESSLRQQVTLQEEKAHDSWLRVRALERTLDEQSREAAYLKHRLEISQNNKALVLERPYVEDPPQRDPEPGAAPLRSSSSGSSFPAGWTEEGKQTPLQRPEGGSSPGRSPLEMPPEAVNMAARGHPPSPGPPFMYHPVGGPPPPMLRHEPPPPPSEPLGHSPPPLPHHLDDYIDV